MLFVSSLLLSLAALCAAAPKELSARGLGEGFALVQCSGFGVGSFGGLAFYQDWAGRGAPGGNEPDELILFLFGSSNVAQDVIEDATCVHSDESGAITCWTFEDGADIFSPGTEIGTAVNSFKSHYICFRGSENEMFVLGAAPCTQQYYCTWLFQL